MKNRKWKRRRVNKMEQEIEIKINGEYKNISLKSNLTKGIKGIEEGNYVLLEKLYDVGFEKSASKEGRSWSYFITSAKYKEDTVSFFLSAKENEKWISAGEIGDMVKVGMTKIPMTNKKTGVEMFIPTLTFEKVE